MTGQRANRPTGEQANGLTGEQANRPTGEQANRTKFSLKFRGHEKAWRGDRNNALVRSFLAGVRSVDASEKLGFVLKSGTSDMNVVGPRWQCPIVAYGPGDSSLDHTPNEHLPLDEYWRAVQVIDQTLQAFSASR
jgi:[amino group carrier protein]-lysine/ornithine hydrolase